jgi:hypothetical protein
MDATQQLDRQQHTYGLELPPSNYTPFRSPLRGPDVTASGNIVLRVGREHNRPIRGYDAGTGGWEVTEHVVLVPGEVRKLIDALEAALNPEAECGIRIDRIEKCVREVGHEGPCQGHTRFVTHPEERVS